MYIGLEIHNFSVILLVSSLPNPKFAAMAEGSSLDITNYLEKVEKASPRILNAYIKQVWTFPGELTVMQNYLECRIRPYAFDEQFIWLRLEFWLAPYMYLYHLETLCFHW